MTTTFDLDEIERLLAAAEEDLIWEDQVLRKLDLAHAVMDHFPAMIAELRELRAENARLREESAKAGEPHWFYAEDWEERCLHSPDEAIDLLDFPPGEYVTEVSTARPCPSIWCAVRVSDDEDADERFTFTEHETEADARAALGEPQ